jgi:nucleoside phosphorylase
MAVILTALELEHNVVAAQLTGPITEHTERGLIFDVGSFTGKCGWTVAVAQSGPGNTAAGVLLERAVAAFRPQVAMFVGIAGGRKDVRHGDVVVADAVYDYESGKAGTTDYLPRIKTAAPSFALEQRARSVARANRWQQRIRPSVPAQPPKAFVKPIAAGGKVIAGGRSATAEFLSRHCGDALAVDMESYGFLHGAYVNKQVDTLVVRGISDLLDDKTAENDRDWQVPAASHAAAFAFELLAMTVPDPAAPSAVTPVRGGDVYSQFNQPAPGGVVIANQGGGNQIFHNVRGGDAR